MVRRYGAGKRMASDQDSQQAGHWINSCSVPVLSTLPPSVVFPHLALHVHQGQFGGLAMVFLLLLFSPLSYENDELFYKLHWPIFRCDRSKSGVGTASALVCSAVMLKFPKERLNHQNRQAAKVNRIYVACPSMYICFHPSSPLS